MRFLKASDDTISLKSIQNLFRQSIPFWVSVGRGGDTFRLRRDAVPTGPFFQTLGLTWKNW
jgi:hypothetical protein